MAKLLLKAMWVSWPFFKSLIFRDRPVREVLSANRQFTLLFGFLMVTLVILYFTAKALSDTKNELAVTYSELTSIRLDTQQLAVEREQLRERLSQVDDQCNIPTEPYDVNRVMRLLRHY